MQHYFTYEHPKAMQVISRHKQNIKTETNQEAHAHITGDHI
jgi:hypothetical protein